MGVAIGMPRWDNRVPCLADVPLCHPQPLFSTSSQQQYIQPFTLEDYTELTKEFEREPVNPPSTPKYPSWLLGRAPQGRG